ncbi:PRC-barrel domain-containing protein [uncultured Rhodoblastus sp.]|uniref:PRC-barrel domain-containing protein n=1 Tax=uncultured Rhodoblastus sp. TaxID=543037 RepID=UPI0025E93A22|nr:PRC-barrel domain-containing protein [uncultured Rhodoblastus sp.]
MLKFASAFRGFALRASDGEIGAIADFLFDDRFFAARWLVVDTGGWLSARKVLLHPEALGKPDRARLELPVALTRAQIEGSPALAEHLPVSMQMERHLYDYYGWEPMANDSALRANPIASKFSAPPLFMVAPQAETAADPLECDVHLRSVNAIAGYRVIGSDGALGAVEDLLIDEDRWSFPYLVVDTGNWFSEKHVLISRHAVKDISWSDREIRVDVSGGQVEASPAWSALGDVDPYYEKDLHDPYDWPGHRGAI